MKSIERRNSGKIFALFVFAQLLLPLFSISFFQRRGNDPVETIFYHEFLIILGYSVVLGLAMLPTCFRAVRVHPAARYLLPLLWGGFTVALYFTHVFAWVGHIGLGMNLTPSMIAPYVLHPSTVFRTLPISPLVFWSVLLVIPLAVLSAYLLAAPSLSAALLRLQAGLGSLRRRRFTSVQSFGVVGVAFVLAFLADFGLSHWPPKGSVLRLFGDPMFVTLVDPNVLLPVYELGAASDAARDSYKPPTQFQKKNVILIVVDSCRADRLGLLGYGRDDTPFLDSLQQSGHLRAVHAFYSASCCTFGGVMTLLRSQHWFKMSRRGFALQDVLKKAGYRIHFLLSGDLSNFQDIKFFYGSNVDTFSDGLSSERHFSMNDDRGVFESLDKIAASDGTPSFFYFHLMSVHRMGDRQPEYLRYQTAGTQTPATQYSDRYDNGVLQADGNIRKLFAELEAKGYLQNSFVIITGDHGDSTGERGITGHGQNLYSEEVNPPLFIYDTDPVVYRNLTLAHQIDVAPTILDRLGLPIPPSWDGHSLLRDEPQRFSYLRMADIYAVIDHTPARTLKYIYDDGKKTEQIYDETHDPHDQQDIFASTDAREIQELRVAVGAFSVHPGS